MEPAPKARRSPRGQQPENPHMDIHGLTVESFGMADNLMMGALADIGAGVQPYFREVLLRIAEFLTAKARAENRRGSCSPPSGIAPPRRSCHPPLGEGAGTPQPEPEGSPSPPRAEPLRSERQDAPQPPSRW